MRRRIRSIRTVPTCLRRDRIDARLGSVMSEPNEEGRAERAPLAALKGFVRQASDAGAMRAVRQRPPVAAPASARPGSAPTGLRVRALRHSVRRGSARRVTSAFHDGSRSSTRFELSDRQWEALMIPIDLAFFLYSSAAGQMVAVYPSPAGPTESLLHLDAWDDIARDHPRLRALEPDVEALLVNRVRPREQGTEARILRGADRRVLQARRVDPKVVARLFRRNCGLGRDRGVLRRPGVACHSRRGHRPCLN